MFPTVQPTCTTITEFNWRWQHGAVSKWGVPCGHVSWGVEDTQQLITRGVSGDPKFKDSNYHKV